MAEPLVRRWPAIELRVEPGTAASIATLHFDDRLALAIDDLAATAVEEAGERIRRVYFADRASRDVAVAVLPRALGQGCSIIPVEVEDQGWLPKVQPALGAVRVGRFVVAPPWDLPAGPPEPAAVPIVIEPSMGFGTGHHESTRLCLRALDSLHAEGRRVLDVGTGSGVLAIAAARLSAAQVVAVDIDPDATAAARDNVRRNRVGARVEVRHADVATMDVDPADLVLANLTAALLVRQAGTLSALVAPGGALVTAGFTTDQASTVIDAFRDLEVTAQLAETGWACVVFRRA